MQIKYIYLFEIIVSDALRPKRNLEPLTHNSTFEFNRQHVISYGCIRGTSRPHANRVIISLNLKNTS